MFRVGQKVVCVDAARGNYSRDLIWENPLVEGTVYVVRWIGPFHPSYVTAPEICIRVDGIVRRGLNDMPFRAVRFRPVVERKTSIEVFRKLLQPKHETV